MNCGFTKHVYQYALRILPDEIFDASRVNDILKTKHRYIYKLMGTYAPSGQMIFTMSPIEEDVNIETTYLGQPCQIMIEKSTETQTLLNADFSERYLSRAEPALTSAFLEAIGAPDLS